jgi:GMP synthase-like glutamine amidotransferase
MKITIFQHVPYEDPGMILDWTAERNHDVSFVNFYEDFRMPDAGSADMLIIMGGPMGAYDEGKFPWLKDEKNFIRECAGRNMPVLGICLGSQLLAECLGGRVYPNRQKEVGFFPVTMSGEAKSDPVFRDAPAVWDILHWHGDTFNLPPGAIHLASSEVTPNQAFRKEKCLGIQFHPEANLSLLERIIASAEKALTGEGTAQTKTEILSKAWSFTSNRPHLYKILDNLLTL